MNTHVTLKSIALGIMIIFTSWKDILSKDALHY